MTPETKAREKIDAKLGKAGWIIQDMRQISPMAALGVAVREYPTSTGPVDYVLFVDGSPAVNSAHTNQMTISGAFQKYIWFV